MADYSTNEFKSGLRIIIDGDPCIIVDNEFVKPGKGQAFNRVRIRNLKTGKTIDKTGRETEIVTRGRHDPRNGQKEIPDNSPCCRVSPPRPAVDPSWVPRHPCSLARPVRTVSSLKVVYCILPVPRLARSGRIPQST